MSFITIKPVAIEKRDTNLDGHFRQLKVSKQYTFTRDQLDNEYGFRTHENYIVKLSIECPKALTQDQLNNVLNVAYHETFYSQFGWDDNWPPEESFKELDDLKVRFTVLIGPNNYGFRNVVYPKQA